MKRNYGTVSIGVRTPIIREGDNLASIVVESVQNACDDLNMELEDKDVIAITESIVARSQGNYATVDDIAEDIRRKLDKANGGRTVGLVFPILSRNRFSMCLKGIARGADKVIIQLSYPSDEVGNKLVSDKEYYASGVDDMIDYYVTDTSWKQVFPNAVHEFTGVDYLQYYREIVENEGAECKIVLSNYPQVLATTFDADIIIACDIHTRNRTIDELCTFTNPDIVYSLTDILSEPINDSGYSQYGLLGSNKASNESVKLFPRISEAMDLVHEIQNQILRNTGKKVEIMVYGDGAFKDPQGKIWELADPVVSPAYTNGLIGTPNEVKIKYLADNDYANLNGEELNEAIKDSIRNKNSNLVGNMVSEGTTPRQLTDLLGSLSDLTSGSGDKGTPVVLIKGYFDNYTND